MAVGTHMTADEYLGLGEGDPRTQLVAGEVVLNAPKLTHQIVCTRLLSELVAWTKAAAPDRGMAVLPLDIRLDDANVYNPDVLWYRADRVPARDSQPPSPLPDIAIEVRSPATWRYDVGVKKRVYEEVGLPELWLVDTVADSVLAFRRSGADAAHFDVALELACAEIITSPQLPGFALALAELFAD